MNQARNTVTNEWEGRCCYRYCGSSQLRRHPRRGVRSEVDDGGTVADGLKGGVRGLMCQNLIRAVAKNVVGFHEA